MLWQPLRREINMNHQAHDASLPSPLCSSCGFVNPAGFNFCGKCGTRLGAGVSPPPSAGDDWRASVPAVASGPRLEDGRAERRQLTVLFCDLVGSTQLSSQLDPEDLRDLIRDYQHTSAEVIVAQQGHIAQYLGDGLLVYFGYPQAHENDAECAVRAGLGLVAAIAHLHERWQHRLRVPLAVRIGIHTGPVVVGAIGGGGRFEQLALGQTPNLAARLQSLAQPNAVLLSEITYKLVQDHFECRDFGSHLLKGVAQPVHVYQLLQAHPRKDRLRRATAQELTPLIGRSEELEHLLAIWRRAGSGSGQIVLLSSEAGVGKSRLLHALQERLAGAPHRVLKGRCSSFDQERALHPISEMLEHLFDLEREEMDAVRWAEVEARLGRYGIALAEVQPLFASLPAATPVAIEALSFAQPPGSKPKPHRAVLRLLQALASEQPLFLLLEDLHWADAATLELLELLTEQIASSAIMACFTFRPQFHPPWPRWDHLHALALLPFSPEQTAAMITAVAGGKSLPPEMLQQLVAKTDGVPLFIEELTKMVLESGLLSEQEDRFELAGPLPPLAIPATLQDSLMARLDRLATVKEVAQLGAVIGREFSYELLLQVSQLEAATLQRELARLVEAGLLQQQGSPPSAKYVFKHALIQDTAYQALLRSTRQVYHGRIAQVLAEQFPRIAEAKPELIAYHYTAAKRTAPAVNYWYQAGQRASRRTAHEEAVRHYNKALELVRELPAGEAVIQQELEILIALAAALIITSGYAAAEVERLYARARALTAPLQHHAHLYPALLGLSKFYLLRGDFQQALELGEQALRLANEVQEAALQVESHFLVGTALFHLGELKPAAAALEHGIALYQVPQHRSMITRFGHDSGVSCLCYLARILWFQGHPDQALRRSMEALSLARELAHPFSLAMALAFAALISQLRQEVLATCKLAEEGIAVSRAQHYAFYLAMAKVLHGWARVELHQEESYLAEIEEGLRVWRATGTQLFRPHLLALLAEAYATVERAAEGLQVLHEALGAAQMSGKRFYQAELYRLQGILLMQLGASREEVERSLRQALALARDRQAKSLELRAAISLCSYQENDPESRALLREICGWFSEGHDTLDLQLAAAMLNRA